MTESILEALRRMSKDSESLPETSEAPHENNSETSFLAALPVVRKIVRRKKSAMGAGSDEDLEQGIILRLLKWKRKYDERSGQMSQEDWESFAARAAYNEASRQSANENKLLKVSLDAAAEVKSPEQVEAESKHEFYSLAAEVWQHICRITFRQRRALLLHSQELVIYLLQAGVCDEELAENLGLSPAEWNDIKQRLPLSDMEIALLTDLEQTAKKTEISAKSIKKARYEARARLSTLKSR